MHKRCITGIADTNQGALILLPLGDVPPAWAARILRFSISSAVKFFPMRLIMEDEAALQRAPGKYIVGEGQTRTKALHVCFHCAMGKMFSMLTISGL